MCEGPPSCGSCHSMAGMGSGCRFYTSGGQRRRRLRLLTVFRLIVFGAEGHPGVELIEVSLKSFLRLFGQAREFDAHADAGVASANHSRGCDALLFDPQ